MADQGHDYIPAGYVRRAHGIGGDVVVRGMLTDAVDRFVVGAVFVTNEDAPRRFAIDAVRPHQGDLIVSFADVDDRNDADRLRGVQFMIERSDRRRLGEGEWWPEDLVGCEVVSVDGSSVGRVVDVVIGSSQDRIVVEVPGGVRGEIPFVEALVPRVDVDRRRIVTQIPEGLFEG